MADFLGITLNKNGELEEGSNNSSNVNERQRTLSSSTFINSVLAAAEPDWHNNGVATVGSSHRLELLEKKFKEGKLSAAEYSALRQREATAAKMHLETKEWEDRQSQSGQLKS